MDARASAEAPMAGLPDSASGFACGILSEAFGSEDWSIQTISGHY